MKLTTYLFSAPVNGSRAWIFSVCVILAALIAVAAEIVVRRSGYIVVRRRARALRSIALFVALCGAAYLAARALKVDFFNWRIWMYLIFVVTFVRGAGWVLSLRSLAHDKVVETQARQKQSYFRKRTNHSTRRRRRS
jgi:hypothetical protein